jgi:Tfp pilus assembly protein PilW
MKHCYDHMGNKGFTVMELLTVIILGLCVGFAIGVLYMGIHFLIKIW